MRLSLVKPAVLVLVLAPMVVAGEDLPFNPFRSAAEGDWEVVVSTITAPGHEPRREGRELPVRKVDGKTARVGSFTFYPVESGSTGAFPGDGPLALGDLLGLFGLGGLTIGDVQTKDETLSIGGRELRCKRLDFSGGHRGGAATETGPVKVRATLWLSEEIKGPGIARLEADVMGARLVHEVRGFGHGDEVTWGLTRADLLAELKKTALIEAQAGPGAQLIATWRAPVAGRIFGVRALVPSPDGKTVLSAAQVREFQPGVFELRETASGKVVHAADGKSLELAGVALSGDGRRALLASGSECELWDVEGWKRLATIPGPTDAVALSPDGNRALAGRALKLWDLATLAATRTFEGGTSQLLLAAFLPGEKEVLAGGRVEGLVVLDRSTGKALRALSGPRDPALAHGEPVSTPVRAFAVSADGKRALSGDRGLRLWDVASGREVRALEQDESGIVTALAISPDGQHALFGDDDGLIRRWDLTTGRCGKVVTVRAHAITALTFLPDGTFLAGTRTGAILRYEPTDSR